MKILVTGGAGFIGSVVSQQLISLNHDVTILDNLSTGHVGSIPTGANFVSGSLLNTSDIESALMGNEAVIHFAAKSLVGESMLYPEEYWENNLEGTRNLLASMNNLNIKKIVFSSTAAVYGEPTEIPLTENSPLNPKSPYGESKLAVENLLSEYCDQSGFAAISLRYFNVAGASGSLGERHNPETHLIPRVLQSLLQSAGPFEIFGDDWPTPDGTCIRDYIHVEDLARAHVLALDNLEPGKHKIFNLGSGNGSSVLQVIAAIESATGKKVNSVVSARRSGDPAILITSITAAEQNLGWQPKLDLNQMVADAYRFMIENL